MSASLARNGADSVCLRSFGRPVPNLLLNRVQHSDRFRVAVVDAKVATGTLTNLNDLVVPSDSGWQPLKATDINNAGQIVGRGLIGDQIHAFLLTPTR
jgi:probable HAF family extracellular repeat protein